MSNYQKAFHLALVGNIVLLAALGGFWWSRHKIGGSPAPLTSTPPAAQQTPHENQGKAPAPAPETPLTPVQLSAERLQSIGVKFGLVERTQVLDEIRATATVAVDETRLSYVQTRISGHIEKVFADATYRYVRKGQPLFTLHSPELIAAEREYLLAKQNAVNLSRSTVPGVASGAASLLESVKERLEQWSIPQHEIERLESTGEVPHAIEIDSPVSGFVTERTALPNLMVQPDTRLYTVADLSQVWVLAQVFQNDLGRLKTGAPALLTLDSYPGRVFRGRVDFIYPDVDLTTRTARVRIVFPNPNLALKPGMYVNVDFRIALGTQVVIPASGVLQSGTREIVFVDRGNGYLEPRDVQLGEQAGERYVVMRGLKAGERIVTSANFLVDSESQLQAAIASFEPAPTAPNAASPSSSPATENGVQLEFFTEPATPHKGRNTYRVQLKGKDGSPIPGARISVRSFMPGMPEMGMATMNVVTDLRETSPGLYEAQTELGSGGKWQITITASKNGAPLAARQLSIFAEGGM